MVEVLCHGRVSVSLCVCCVLSYCEAMQYLKQVLSVYPYRLGWPTYNCLIPLFEQCVCV